LKALIKAGRPPLSAVTSVALAKSMRSLGLGSTAIQRNVTKEEVDRARKIAEQRGDDRLALLISLLWVTGARISEVLALEVGDLDLRAKVVQMPTLKRRQAEVPKRGIPLPVAVLGDIALYLNSRQLTRKDRLIGWRRAMAWRVLHQVLLEAGVDDKRAFPHAFRHGHALHALKAGVPINVVQQALGHASILTTQIYLRATGSDIAHSYDRVDW
jgi:integrase/recombinase XerD